MMERCTRGEQRRRDGNQAMWPHHILCAMSPAKLNIEVGQAFRPPLFPSSSAFLFLGMECVKIPANGRHAFRTFIDCDTCEGLPMAGLPSVMCRSSVRNVLFSKEPFEGDAETHA
jgi:hypothetical protein